MRARFHIVTNDKQWEFVGNTMVRLKSYYHQLIISIGNVDSTVTEWLLSNVKVMIVRIFVYLCTDTAEPARYFLKAITAYPNSKRLFDVMGHYEGKVIAHSDAKVIFTPGEQIALGSSNPFTILI